jgi:hypothetical protein
MESTTFLHTRARSRSLFGIDLWSAEFLRPVTIQFTRREANLKLYSLGTWKYTFPLCQETIYKVGQKSSK